MNFQATPTPPKPTALRWAPLFLLTLLLPGCKSPNSENTWSGPTEPVSLRSEPWTFYDRPARIIHTPHYAIHTTITDNRFLDTTCQVMEGAYQQYRQFVPTLPLSDKPMDCFIFSQRADWEIFTHKTTGALAPVYLKITRGGYAVRDWYVAYYMGDYSTFSVAAHEGWHQFCGRNFKGRLPPFLEEGIATLFEGVSLSGPHGLPRWNYSVNLNRAVRLREAVQSRRLWPLEQLITLHAGNVIELSGDKIDSFYSQNWAFARFLWDSQNAKYRPALQHLLTDVASGQVFDPSAAGLRPSTLFRPESVKGILEHYLNIPFPKIDKEFTTYLNQIAFDQFTAQWQS